MKNFLCFLLLGFAFFANAQQKITFTYDQKGNQTFRTLCLSGCSAKPAKNIDVPSEADLETFFPGDVISYYPNPVKEELYLKWKLIDDDKVTSITVYGINGQVLKTFSKTSTTDNLLISFQEYPVGVYILTLNYLKDEQKTIKIIKQ
ncbi:T9SS type A sorting domain-containing protein [Flavobacterium daemonense]|uniref:T9SS type A sorting domain-containing protein n=1 Tax=Flavobacterium daemonense TaxID=1393049 RepID=UPI001185BF43|nr:T9SS type A sorting domain-containing protein [Flavobacterium daemonense]KAF2331984.1 T9SS type A sorting domain-containing protein [Flavobacterium daemonense]